MYNIQEPKGLRGLPGVPLCASLVRIVPGAQYTLPKHNQESLKVMKTTWLVMAAGLSRFWGQKEITEVQAGQAEGDLQL
jgi:hypothetical protein